jgi:phospholipid/cholesterol/gamma-HCH transport system permease protein
LIDLKIKIAWLVKSLLVFLLEIQGGKYYTLVLNSIMKHLAAIGQYFLMIREVFKKPTKWKVMRGLILKEIDELIYGSMGIVIFVSFFIGGVVTIQTALNLNSPLIPKNLIGFAARQSVILEFAPTFTSIIMAGKVGSFITSSIGSMRVTEQIDALEVMGINSLNYLVFPKIIALLMYPFVIAIAMYLGIFGGFLAGVLGEFSTAADFIEGVRIDFVPFHVAYAFIKTMFFAFIIATVPSFHGYYMKGGALEVGKASTTSFVWTAVVIITTNYILTQLLLG